MVNLSIIGFEHVHAPHYLACLRRMPNVQVGAVAEPDAKRLELHAQLLEGVAVYTDYRKMLQEVSSAGVIVCSANVKHKEMVIDCARAGIPILCEKPIATKAADAREMLAICQAHDVPLGMCFPGRFSTVLSQARKIIHAGNLGKVLAVKSTNHGTMPGDWFVNPQLAGGGAIIDHTVHVVDALRWLFGAEFTHVFTHAATRLYDLPVEDVALLTLEMSNEVIVTLDTSWSRPTRSFPIWGDVSLVIVGTDGILNLELFPWTLNYFSEEVGKHLAIAHDGDLNQQLLDNFVTAAEGKRSLSPSGTDGLRALEVVEAAYRSIATNQVIAL
jgi:myo-inositol 2-dehydrogenase/D-chiro-inositol 1-dehydrogenase